VDWSDVLRAAASFFLVLTGLALTYALIRAARMLDHVSSAIDRSVDEALPLLGKAGETLDQVSGQLANAERITGTAADAVEAAERSARAVVAGVGKPVAAVAGAVSKVESGMRRIVRRPR
jgi:F0F1-type ATP synthase membrane subunit b/b'